MVEFGEADGTDFSPAIYSGLGAEVKDFDSLSEEFTIFPPERPG
jgi:hypothetical protein